jgi:hypothetical protein
MNGALLGLVSLLCVSTSAAQPLPAGPCADEVAQKAMAHALYQDQEDSFRQFVCGDEACTEAAFREGLEFRQETLRDSPLALGCFVDPGRRSTDTLVALFLWSGSTPKLEMVFSGRDLSTDRQNQGHGFKALIGAHRTEVDYQPEERFVWNGRGYQATEKRPVPPLPPEASPDCLRPATRSAMSHVLYGNKTFRRAVCDDPSCSEQDFDEHMSYRQTALRDEPALIGCFAEPSERSAKSLTGVFSLADAVPGLFFIYAGMRIEADPKHHDRGYARLIGKRQQSATTTLLQSYRWNGHAYALTSVTRTKQSAPLR